MARLAYLFGTALRCLGFAPLIYAAGLFGWQAFTWLKTGTWVGLPTRLLVDASAVHAPAFASIAPLIPALDWHWANHGQSLLPLNRLLGVLLDRVHLGLVAAALGYAVMQLGAAIVARQAEILELRERQRADRRRRLDQYAGF